MRSSSSCVSQCTINDTASVKRVVRPAVECEELLPVQLESHGQHAALGPRTALAVVRDLAAAAGLLSAWSLNHRHGVIFCILASPSMLSVGATKAVDLSSLAT